MCAGLELNSKGRPAQVKVKRPCNVKTKGKLGNLCLPAGVFTSPGPAG